MEEKPSGNEVNTDVKKLSTSDGEESTDDVQKLKKEIENLSKKNDRLIVVLEDSSCIKKDDDNRILSLTKKVEKGDEGESIVTEIEKLRSIITKKKENEELMKNSINELKRELEGKSLEVKKLENLVEEISKMAKVEEQKLKLYTSKSEEYEKEIDNLKEELKKTQEPNEESSKSKLENKMKVLMKENNDFRKESQALKEELQKSVESWVKSNTKIVDKIKSDVNESFERMCHCLRRAKERVDDASLRFSTLPRGKVDLLEENIKGSLKRKEEPDISVEEPPVREREDSIPEYSPTKLHVGATLATPIGGGSQMFRFRVPGFEDSDEEKEKKKKKKRKKMRRKSSPFGGYGRRKKSPRDIKKKKEEPSEEDVTSSVKKKSPREIKKKSPREVKKKSPREIKKGEVDVEATIDVPSHNKLNLQDSEEKVPKVKSLRTPKREDREKGDVYESDVKELTSYIRVPSPIIFDLVKQTLLFFGEKLNQMKNWKEAKILLRQHRRDFKTFKPKRNTKIMKSTRKIVKSKSRFIIHKQSKIGAILYDYVKKIVLEIDNLKKKK